MRLNSDAYISDGDLSALDWLEKMRAGYRLAEDRTQASELVSEALEKLMQLPDISERAKYYVYHLLAPALDLEEPRPVLRPKRRMRGRCIDEMGSLRRDRIAEQVRRLHIVRLDERTRISMDKACQLINNDLEAGQLTAQGKYLPRLDAKSCWEGYVKKMRRNGDTLSDLDARLRHSIAYRAQAAKDLASPKWAKFVEQFWAERKRKGVVP